MLVEDLTAEELKQYRLEGTDEQIPLLEEVLELFQDRTPLIIELKAERGNHAALAEATCACWTGTGFITASNPSTPAA